MTNDLKFNILYYGFKFKLELLIISEKDCAMIFYV